MVEKTSTNKLEKASGNVQGRRVSQCYNRPPRKKKIDACLQTASFSSVKLLSNANVRPTFAVTVREPTWEHLTK